jgi:hypothetical protein
LSDEEQVLPGPLKGLGTTEEREVYRYRRPSGRRISYRRKVFQVEEWIRRKGIVPKEDVILYIMRAFDMERPAALTMFTDVKKDFARIGKVYGE